MFYSPCKLQMVRFRGGEEHGLNDAGFETLKKEDSRPRETCQDIVDV